MTVELETYKIADYISYGPTLIYSPCTL